MNRLCASSSFVGYLELEHVFPWKQECAQAHLTHNVLLCNTTMQLFS